MAKKPKGIKKKARIHNGITGESWVQDVEVTEDKLKVFCNYGMFMRQHGTYRKLMEPSMTLEVI